jgi:hypothetical protein
MKVPLGGGPAVTLATDASRPFAIAVDARRAYWLSGFRVNVTYNAMKVPLDGGTASSLSLGGPSPSPMAMKINYPSAMAVNGSGAYLAGYFEDYIGTTAWKTRRGTVVRLGSCDAGACDCPAKDVVCSGACVDVDTDPMNCGTCGYRCKEGCVGGVCQCASSEIGCGGNCCAAGTTCQGNDFCQ